MTDRAPRYVPAVTGIFWIAVAIAIIGLWPSPEGILWWVRGLAVGLPLLFGLSCLRDALFASDAQIRDLVDGDSKTAGKVLDQLAPRGLVRTLVRLIASRRFALGVAFAAVAAFFLIDSYVPVLGIIGNAERGTITITRECLVPPTDLVWQPPATDRIVQPPSGTQHEGPWTKYQQSTAPTRAMQPASWLPCGLALPYRWIAFSTLVLLGLHFVVRANRAVRDRNAPPLS